MIDMAMTSQMRLQLATLKGSRLLSIDGSMKRGELLFDNRCVLNTSAANVEVKNAFSVNSLFDPSEEITQLQCKTLAKGEQVDFSSFTHGAYDIPVGEEIRRVALVNDEIESAQPNFPLVKTTAIAFFIDSGMLCLSQGMFIDDELVVSKTGSDWMDALRSLQDVAEDFDAWGKYSPTVTRSVVEL